MENKDRQNMHDHQTVAIIGMGCIYPKSTGLQKYWDLLYLGRDAITDVPDSHWSPSDYFDPDPKTPDHVYCKRGGFISPVDFDPSEFGIPPSSLEATDTSQLLGLLAAKMALDDCRFDGSSDFNRDRTSVILGVTGTQELVIPLGSRLGHPIWRRALEQAAIPADKAREVITRISESYVAWQENSFPGLLGNVVAGRICNRLDLKGTNCVVDAACASSMSAIHLAVLELVSGRSDLVVTGGVDTINDIFMHMCFAKTGTLSPTGDARPFSKDADGTVLGEGIGILVLKRLAEAELDGNRIYAVIRSLGSSSDGRSQSIYSPRVEGQIQALKAAYENAGVDPATVELVEAHGTGTRVGDKVEIEALCQVFGRPQGSASRCALGSVKSMIGHTKAASGAAGLIKAALGLYHKVLPPTLKADKPDPALKIEDSPFYLNRSARPWFSSADHPRRAGVSAFGFGGSNFHAVLEEYEPRKTETSWIGTPEILAFSAQDASALIEQVREAKAAASRNLSADKLAALAAESRQRFASRDPNRLLLVCDDAENSRRLLEEALEALDQQSGVGRFNLENIYGGSGPAPGKLALVFPGQGSQYPDMGRDLICLFPRAMEVLEEANRKFGSSRRLSDLIFPLPAAAGGQHAEHEQMLRRTEVAQPAIGAVSLAMFQVLQQFKVTPAATCGHSFGELTALCAAGWMEETAFLDLAVARGRLMADVSTDGHRPAGAMLAVYAPLEKIQALLASAAGDVVLANHNSPGQGVLSGPASQIAAFEAVCRKNDIRCVRLPVSAAFHSPQVKGAVKPFALALSQVDFQPTAVDVYSNSGADAYCRNPGEIRRRLGEHLACPVEFAREIENLYQAGIRTFVEVGPRSILTRLIGDILQKRQFEAVALDASGGKAGGGMQDLAALLCRLASLGYTVALDRWGRDVSNLREPKMKIPLSGANYRQQKPDLSPAPTSEDKPRNDIKPQNSTDQEHMKKSDVIMDAFSVVAEGLKSMQQLQLQTTRAHEKFLESQAEANRALQEIMRNTQRLAEDTLGIAPQAPQAPVPSALDDPSVQRRPEETIGLPPAAAPVPPANAPAPVPDAAGPVSALPSGPFDSSNSETPANGYANNRGLSSAPPAAHSGGSAAGQQAQIATALLEVVSRLTGYPLEMLGLDMDIEADLGIDSIKRVEILSSLEEQLPHLPPVSPDIMGSLKTLGQIAEFLAASDDPPENKISAAPDAAPGEKIIDDHQCSPCQAGLSDISASLLEVVSRLTGYPLEMLGLDMDIEADLGIDSIKRVEILSSLEEQLPHLPPVSPDIMGSLKTLGQIAEFLAAPAVASNSDAAVAKTEKCDSPNATCQARTRATSPNPGSSIQPAQNLPPVSRRIVSVVPAPVADDAPLKIGDDKVIYVTEEDSGLATQIIAAFSKRGVQAEGIRLDAVINPQQAEKAAGLVIVANPESTQMLQDLKTAFALTKQLAPSLTAATRQGPALLATVTRIDGAFGFNGPTCDHPLQGALAGLAKTAAIEWPSVCCHAIDIAPELQKMDATARSLVSEILTPGPVEIGLHGARRWTLALEDASFPSGSLALSADDVVVISGGARGIAASAALALAAHTRANLVLLGRSPQPVAEPAWLSPLQDEATVKKAILEHDFGGAAASPARIETAFRAYMANCEIAAALKKLKACGASAVQYHSVDVRDAQAVQAVLAAVRTDLGPVSAVIHAAGVLQDRLIIEKTVEQFANVFDTKVMGFLNLLQACAKDPLKYIVAFSSVAARLGNKGQVDYAMANEALNKIARLEAVNRPDCRTIAINWGPWDGGMVTAALKREFQRRGIELIAADDGADCMLREMQGDSSHPVEMVIGAGISVDSATAKKPTRSNPSDRLSSLPAQSKLTSAFEREISIDQYPVLTSHVIDGKPVVPLALMTEWFAHAALHENPGLTFHGLDEIRILKGIRLENQTERICLFAGKPRKKGAVYEVQMQLRGARENGREVLYAQTSAVLTDQPVPVPDFKFSKALLSQIATRKIEEVYDQILFHGPQLHALRRIVSCSARGMVAHVRCAPVPGQWLATPLRNRWIADPLALDGAFQMASLWCFEEKSVVSLPSYALCYRQYRHQFPDGEVICVLEVREATERKMRGDFTFLDANEGVIAQLTGYEAIMDESLNRAFKARYRASA